MAYLVTSRSDGKIPQTISGAKIRRTRKKPNKEAVKQAIDYIKSLMLKEEDAKKKIHLANAGLALTKISR